SIGGNNWSQQSVPLPDRRLNSIFFLDNKIGWIAGAFGKILKTTNGENWYNQTSPNESYEIIFFLDTLNGYAGGTKLVKTTDGGGLTSIIQVSNEIPEQFKLHQNYPNPFNPTTFINYELRNKSIIEISVYSIAGKVIEILVNTEQLPGSYQYTFDASGLPSGIYFYTLIADGIRVDTKKMVLIK